jgi:dihydrofolate reductase
LVFVHKFEGSAVRKITFGGAISLDHYLARPDGAVDWILFGDEAGKVMAEYWVKVDTILMGRKTYEVANRMGQGEFDYGGGIKTYVFSRTLRSPSGSSNLEIISDNVVDFVRRLKGAPGKEICLMGGGELAKPLFEAGLIDEIGFNIHPVLLGSGIPLFHPMSHQIGLELIECRPFKNGCVYITYRVKQRQ